MTDAAAAEPLRTLLARTLPRLLTQMCRDPEHPLYGCFDRHHWHYKMRDFSSAVVVQGALVLDSIAHGELDLPVPVLDRAIAAEWRDAALRHWARTQRSDGSFDEYYPGEAGFPAAGFSLYAAAVIAQRKAPPDEIARAMEKAAAWILRSAETEAVNQEVVALTACSLAARAGVRVDAVTLERRWAAVYAGQSPEGWFLEYGGADTGYLAVACDALWDCWEVTGDERARAAGVRAVAYIHAMLGAAGDVPRFVNSRNADYLTGYGLARFAALAPEAAAVMHATLTAVPQPRHFLHHVDDRYVAHYVHTSWFRALPHVGAMGPAAQPVRGTRWFPHARVLVSHSDDASLYVAAGKGGTVVRVASDGATELDQGWRGEVAGRITTTSWQEHDTRVEAGRDEDAWAITIDMPLRTHGYVVPTPSKRLALLAAGLVAGRRLIPHLKRRLIFRGAPNGARFSRRVRVVGDEAWIADAFHGRPLEGRRREGAYSLRHVSSSGGFAFVELSLRPSRPHLHRSE